MTILESFKRLNKIKTPAELGAERYAQHEAEVNRILNHIRSEFRGLPCVIPMRGRFADSNHIIARPTAEVWKIVQQKLEEELKSAGWEPFDTYLTTSGFLFWKTYVICIMRA